MLFLGSSLRQSFKIIAKVDRCRELEISPTGMDDIYFLLPNVGSHSLSLSLYDKSECAHTNILMPAFTLAPLAASLQHIHARHGVVTASLSIKRNQIYADTISALELTLCIPVLDLFQLESFRTCQRIASGMISPCGCQTRPKSRWVEKSRRMQMLSSFRAGSTKSFDNVIPTSHLDLEGNKR